MSIFSALYQLLIGPLELFFEILFAIANRIVHNPGVAIVFLSLAMNFLVLPLYRMADALQEQERITEQRLHPVVAHIKKTFTGDERFMILQTYYRENGYKTTDPLKGSVSLLLEIPFFMAAYNFLSSLPMLHGASFGPIANLGVPDGMIALGGLSINLLPILMTVINLLSSAIYLKGAPLRSKVQLYVMAGLFLVLLYDSPSGLVFYWTLNNLFSLAKNIFMKLRKPGKVLAILAACADVLLLAFILIAKPMNSAKGRMAACVLLVLALPALAVAISRYGSPKKPVTVTAKDHRTFFIGAVFLTVLTGLMIPSSLLSASPEEFISTVTFANPLMHTVHALLTAAGVFVVWFGIFYLLAGDSGKKWMGLGMCVLCAAAAADAFFFSGSYGSMNPNLKFDVPPVFSGAVKNLAVLAVLSGLIVLLWQKKQELLRAVFAAAAVAAVVMSGMNLVRANQIIAPKTAQLQQVSDEKPTIPLSRDGKNVMVLMMDRGMSVYFPYLLQEKPELQQQFAGFTYYPNTISFGPCTNIGAPALYGGYEYTPGEMNRRSDEPLQKKHDEALKLMPALFYGSGYETTVCDPPAAGYDWIPDLSIYDEYPGIRAYNSMGTFEYGNASLERALRTQQRRDRNFFCYSLMRISPVVLRGYLYDGGGYNDLRLNVEQITDGPSRAEGMDSIFTSAYAVLCNLSDITRVGDGGDTFLMLTNDTTHSPAILQEPEYIPAEHVDNRAYDEANRDRFTLNGRTLPMDNVRQMSHYHANMAAMLKLGEWFDFLRVQGVYDNTRIIIVADHGNYLGQMEDLRLDEREEIMNYNPLLLVKDFGSTELTVDDQFMTNADTPTLAMAGLIESPVNPFTGKPVDSSAKYAGPQKILCSHAFDILVNNGNTYLPGPWYSVHDSIFDLSNWKSLGIE